MEPVEEPVSSSALQLAAGVVLPASAYAFAFSRSSGPGGQNVNKLATKAQLRVALSELRQRMGDAAVERLVALAGPSRLTAAGEIVITSEESRSQHRNRDACVERLRELVLRALRPPRPRRATRPSAGCTRRRLESKKRRGDVKRSRGASHDQ